MLTRYNKRVMAWAVLSIAIAALAIMLAASVGLLLAVGLL